MDEADKMIEDLILNGALEPAGIDLENGEMLYNFTDKLGQVNPELKKEIFNSFYTDVMGLWEKGFIEINLQDEDPVVTITQKALDFAEVNKLSKDDKFSLREIIRVLKIDN
jgi:hypothetical protein